MLLVRGGTGITCGNVCRCVEITPVACGRNALAPKININRDRCGINAIVTDCAEPRPVVCTELELCRLQNYNLTSIPVNYSFRNVYLYFAKTEAANTHRQNRLMNSKHTQA